jgi:hypothetical protein
MARTNDDYLGMALFHFIDGVWHDGKFCGLMDAETVLDPTTGNKFLVVHGTKDIEAGVYRLDTCEGEWVKTWWTWTAYEWPSLPVGVCFARSCVMN